MDRCISNSSSSTVRYIHIIGSALLLVAVILSSTQIESSEARSLTSDDDFFVQPLVKRNTWWTKKSLNAMDTIPHSSYESQPSGYDKCQDTVEIYSCYVTKCVQNFVKCARQAGSDELFGACKMLHKMCASSCSKNSHDDVFQL